MGESKGVRVFDPMMDKSLTTKGDIRAMETNVHSWCDQLQKQSADEQAALLASVIGEIRAGFDLLGGKLDGIAGAQTEYRRDDLRYRNNISARGRVVRVRNWLVWLLTFGLVTLGGCVGGEPVSGNEYLHVTVDSTRHVACYFSSVTGQHGAGALSCVRVDSLGK